MTIPILRNLDNAKFRAWIGGSCLAIIGISADNSVAEFARGVFGIVNVKIAIFTKVRVKRQAKQALLPFQSDITFQI